MPHQAQMGMLIIISLGHHMASSNARFLVFVSRASENMNSRTVWVRPMPCAYDTCLKFECTDCAFSDAFAGKWKAVEVKPKSVAAQRVLRSNRLEELQKSITADCVGAVKVDADSRNKSLRGLYQLCKLRGGLMKTRKRFLVSAFCLHVSTEIDLYFFAHFFLSFFWNAFH